MNFLQTILAFIVALGSLVIFHELGHYWVARWCGVKVLRFSVGMGKVVFSRRFGPDQTEWAISALPLGGYVKMLDAREQDLGALSPRDLRREFTRQSVWRRIAIVAAGPIANFLLAIALFAGLFMHGVAEPTSKIYPPPADSAAYLAGLRGGDTITAVNGVPVAVWSELRWQMIAAVLDKNPRGARLRARRPDGAIVEAQVPATALAGMDPDGDVLGKVGIDVARPAPVLGQVLAGGAAERAGLRQGDVIVAVDGKPVADGIVFIDMMRASGGKNLVIALRRAGQALQLAVTPATEREGAVTVGKIKAEVALMPDMIVVASSPPAAVGKAVGKVWDASALTLKMMGKMIVGQASLKNITGPITIADYAGQSARIGAASYLTFIAFISISLGVMNLLPIPVLDGGLLLYYSLEVFTGRPLPERVGAMAQRVGLGLLLSLMALAVFNDVARLLT
ncbi:MAG TPA: RIP metalloprotease RseP [Janthinobacterium sp.]|nr:RIP metalloprotease RseP [Janthinobacterium sp.]